MNLLKKLSLSALAVIGLASITACGGFDKDKGYTDITSKLTLKKDYKGKSFFDDGIGLAEVERLTDGDTSTFNLAVQSKDGSSSVVIRYDGINTPESTIEIRPWGKSAAKYNFNRLENAYQIVIEGIYVSSADNSKTLEKTGNRYLGYVWYRNSESDSFKNLNLEMVENGYSKSMSPIKDYEKYFIEAEAFAKKHKMHIHSNDVDPNYTGDVANDVSLEEICKDLASDDPTLYSKDIGAGAKVAFEATILNHKSDSTHYYTVGAIGLDGVLYSMDIFAGYSSYPINAQEYLTIGSTYHIVARISTFNGKYQITDISYSSGKIDDAYTHLIVKDNYALFDSNNTRFRMKSETGLHGDLVVESATYENNTLKIVGNALDYKNAETSKKYTIVVNNVTSYDVSTLTGKSISCGGFKNAAGEIVVLSTNDLKVR